MPQNRFSLTCKGVRRLSTTLAILVMISWLCWTGWRTSKSLDLVFSPSHRNMDNLRSDKSESSTLFNWWNLIGKRATQPLHLDHINEEVSDPSWRHGRRTTTTVKNRSNNVKPNEFFLPPNESSWRYFDESASRPLDFSLHEPSNDFGRLPALWQCRENVKGGADKSPQQQIKVLQQNDRLSKIIFVQLPRSAGHMVQSLLQYYGKACQASFSVILACADLSFQSAQAGYWYNGRRRRSGNHCKLREAFNRTQGVVTDRKKEYVSTSFLEKIDIITGQLPLGSADQAWKYYHDEQTKVITQYVMFFRDPVATLVSQEVARGWRKLTTTESAVAAIKDKVMSERAKGNYNENYIPYLITPEQHFQYEFHEVRPTMDQFVNVSISNLVDLNVAIGIVERMPQSWQLLQHVLDSNHLLDELFQYFGAAGGKTENIPRPIWPRNRKPGLTTAEVLQEIRQDDKLYRKVQEYLKHELQIYEFALELHKRQHQKLPKQQTQEQRNDA